MIAIEISIACDGYSCQERFTSSRTANRKQQRSRAKEKGWVYMDKFDKDYCPLCAKILQEHIVFEEV